MLLSPTTVATLSVKLRLRSSAVAEVEAQEADVLIVMLKRKKLPLLHMRTTLMLTVDTIEGCCFCMCSQC
jgi:hypothetical protein